MNMAHAFPQRKRAPAAYLNLTARAWRQLRRSWRLPATLPVLIQAHLMGPARSLMAALQAWTVGRPHRALDQVEAVFILGFWRSGTTLLHELMATDENFAYPTSYACFHPHHFLFSQRFATNSGEVRRPQDQVMTGWRTPQEDEFALLCLGARSPYEGLIAAADFASAMKLADPEDLPTDDARRWERLFLRFFRAVWRAGGKRALVLKSPTHSYRVRTLRRLVPNARFVLLVRDPYEIFESMMKTYRAFSLRYGLVPGLPNRELREMILAERLRCEEKLRTGLSGLGSDRLAVVKYEELIADPVATVETIYRQFGLPQFERIRPRLVEKARALRSSPRMAANLSSPWRDRLKLAWAEIFDRYGYDPGG